MKKILVTGGLGFIGTNFLKYLIKKRNYSILNLDRYDYCSNSSFKKNFKYYKFIKIDLSSAKISKIKKIINTFKPQYVLNFAANSHVDWSISDPLNFVKSNYTATLNILVSIANADKKIKLFQIGTDEIYGEIKKNQKKVFQENSHLEPSNPYSASKAACNLLVKSFSKTYGLKYVILNPSNNFGPFQYKDKLIPKTIIDIIKKRKVKIFKNGENIRQWMYVEDTCKVIELALNHAKINNTYNLGYGSARSNNEIVRIIHRNIESIKKKKIKIKVDYIKDRKGHDFKYFSNGSKLKKIIKIKPIKFLDGIKQTIKWYLDKENLKLFKK